MVFIENNFIKLLFYLTPERKFIILRTKKEIKKKEKLMHRNSTETNHFESSSKHFS